MAHVDIRTRNSEEHHGKLKTTRSLAQSRRSSQRSTHLMKRTAKRSAGLTKRRAILCVLKDGFYLDKLANYVTKAQGGLDVTLALSNETPQGACHPAYDEIQLASGFVHAAMASSMADRYQNVLAYLAGPPRMVDAVLRVLITEGQLPPQAIR